MEPMQWLTLIVFACTILVVISNGRLALNRTPFAKTGM